MAEEQSNLRDLDLVLVTGAGASREFGVGGKKLPLMGDWCEKLVAKLTGASWAYLEATGLQHEIDGPEFERRLGRFLRMVRSFSDIEPLLKSSLKFQSVDRPILEQQLEEWHRIGVFHQSKIIDLIHEALYEEFSAPGIDFKAAEEAYRRLFGLLRIDGDSRFVYSTTNFDPIGEHVVDALGWLPDWGQQHSVEASAYARVRVDGLLDGIPRYVPVLHLHGRVGWYRIRDSQMLVATNTARHDQGSGTPLVMLPDPDKSYDADDAISALWVQFAAALARAKRVFILGHSLNDRALVDVVKTNVHPLDRVAVGLLSDPTDPSRPDPSAGPTLEIAQREFGNACAIPLRFGDSQATGSEGLEQWFSRLERGDLL